MAEPRELKSLKRSIPPDLQKKVEDIQIKVERTTGPPGDLDEERKRWLIVGFCLHSIISPLLRKYVDPIMKKLYTSLVSSDSIDTQGYHRYLKKYPNANRYYLNYESINNNKNVPKKKINNKWVNDYQNYDYKVMSHVDLSKLFLLPNMALYSAFDGTCDASALTGMVFSISSFPSAVQTAAEKIRSDIRNRWAHCDFTEWTTAKYKDSFDLMGQLVGEIGLSNREENTIRGELNTWATNGQHYFSGGVLGLEIVEEMRQHTHILSEYVQTLCTSADSQFIRVQKELKNLKHILEERIKNLEHVAEEHAVTLRELKTEMQNKNNDHIPKNIRAQHNQVIMEWENDEASFYETRAANYILKSVASNDCIIVTGSSGCGKSSNIHHVALHLRNTYGYEIVPVLIGPSDIINYKDENTEQVFVVDDICGKETINMQTLQMWRDYSEKMGRIFKTEYPEEQNQHSDHDSNMSRSKLLISCRRHIYREPQFQLDNFLTRKECDVLSPELCLLQEEKIQMAKIYHLDNMIDKVIKFKENIDFFPLICKLSKNKSSEEVSNLFTAPVYSIRKNIKHIIIESDMQFCALVLCVLYEDGFDTDWLKLQSILETEKRNKLEDIVKEFDIKLSREMSRKTLKLAFDTLVGTYLRQSGTEYRMIHDMIYKLAAVICGQKLTECFIKHAPSVLIRDNFIFNSVTDSPVNDDVIMLSEDVEEEYFERLLNDLKESIMISTFHNKQLIHNAFREKLIQTFVRKDEAKQVLKDFDPKGNKMKRDENSLDWYYSLTTPLMQSVSDGYYDIVHFLIETVKCDVNIRDQKGRSLLYKASEGGKTDVVQLLLQKNTNVSNCQTNGSCPLYVACEKGYTDIVNILLKNSYGLFLIECINGHTSNTFTDRCRFCSSQDRSNRFISSPNRNLRDEDYFCICEQGQERESPLYVAYHTSIVDMLLKYGADISHRNNDGESPLYAACANGHKDIVEILMQNQANVSQCDNNGNTQLQAAVAN
ncbi:unnamed protein product [Mytilus edulis]|uniref:Novel STAND NTPase 3 domain-containing protein n=1 Tax=Mytilus edulis TaxID=6550 RepID=A0A8S3TDZ7_MYTED|nr:unnamed protein product [Mytilus edulis]